MQRAVVLLLLLAVLLAPAVDAGSVEIVSVDHPDPVVYDRTYGVNASLRNTGSEAVEAGLYSVLYEPDGEPCGSASGSDHHGRVSMYVASVTVPAGATVEVPSPDARSPWWHRVNASNDVTAGGRYQVCVFAVDRQGTTPGERYLDHAVRNVTLRMTNEAPQGGFTVTPEEGTTDTVFQFEATATDPDGDPVSFRWDLNDFDASGAVRASGPTVEHEFYPAGVFTVNLTLTDGWDERTISREVVVRLAGNGGAGGGSVPGPGTAAVVAAVLATGLVMGRRRHRAR